MSLVTRRMRKHAYSTGYMKKQQTNDAVASERRIFSENHDYKSFSRVAVNAYILIFWSLDARGGRKRTDTQLFEYS